jgi:preprotein translocase subunit SecE
MNYIKLAYKELVEKVSWPSRSELQSSAIVVMVASAIFAIVVAIMDKGFGFIMDFIYQLFNN